MTKMEKFQDEARYPLILSLISQIKFVLCCSSEISKAFLLILENIVPLGRGKMVVDQEVPSLTLPYEYN